MLSHIKNMSFDNITTTVFHYDLQIKNLFHIYILQLILQYRVNISHKYHHFWNSIINHIVIFKIKDMNIYSILPETKPDYQLIYFIICCYIIITCIIIIILIEIISLLPSINFCYFTDDQISSILYLKMYFFCLIISIISL